MSSLSSNNRDTVTFRVTKYYNTRDGDTLAGCVLSLDRGRKTLNTKYAGTRLHPEFNVADIINVTFGRNSGFLCIWLKGGVFDSESRQSHQILLDITPNQDATCVARTIKELNGWDIVAQVYGAKAEKEELITNFSQSLKTEHDCSIISAQVSKDERLQTAKTYSDESPSNSLACVVQSTPGSATSTSENIREKLDSTGDTTPEAESELTLSIPSQMNLKPSSQSMFSEYAVELVKDASIRQPTKRRKLDELDSFYHPALKAVETFETWLLQNRTHTEFEVARMDRLESDNESLRIDLDLSRQQASSSSQVEAKLKKLTSDHTKLETDFHDSQVKVQHKTKRVKTLLEKNTDLQGQVKSLESTKLGLTFRLTQAEAHLREMQSTLSAEKDVLLNTKLEVDAEMFISGVNITDLLTRIKSGTGFDQALQASMRKRSAA